MASMVAPYIHLNTRSSFSLLEGGMTLSHLVKLAKADDQPALALTDRNNLFGALEFSEKAVEAGIQPITGMLASLNRDEWGIELETRFGGAHASLVLLAASQEGLDNLMRLCSMAHVESDPTTGPELAWSALEANAQGLIVLTGGTEGPLDALLRKGRWDQASSTLTRLQTVFQDRLYIELHRHGGNEQRQVEAQLRSWA
jgi:DNA polymerase-3 subunit alpha